MTQASIIARQWSAAHMMNGWAEAILAKYGAIAVGLLFGTTAKYALALGEGRKLTVRMVVIDALLLGMVAIIASTVCERLGATGNTAATLAALFAVSSDRVIRLLRKRFVERVDAEIKAQAAETLGVARQIVTSEQAASRLVSDQNSGRAPDHFKALEPRQEVGE